jgi:hypothetical protein
MTAERDDEKFAQLADAIGPYLDRVVIVGGWAHRLFRNHPLAQALPYEPLMTRDTDIALPTGITVGQESLRERLLSRGFHEQFLGDDRPPVTHYQLGDRDAGFYVEFLTPLVGGEFRRDDTRDVTATIAGITAQKLRYLDVLLIAPWSVSIPVGGDAGQPRARINIANPVSYIVQKLLVSGKRKPAERAKDVLYIHDTLELFGRSSSSLKDLWSDRVRPELGRRSEAKALRARRQLFSAITDTIREAAIMSAGRALSPQAILDLCQVGLAQLMDGPP